MKRPRKFNIGQPVKKTDPMSGQIIHGVVVGHLMGGFIVKWDDSKHLNEYEGDQQDQIKCTSLKGNNGRVS
jgi:hypothetical protein